MKKNKIFVACDSANISKVKNIIKKTKNSKIKIGYKFGLEFLNSKKGRNFVSKLKNEITFGDYKILDIPNTCVSAIKSVKDLKFNYITIHISSGIKALKLAKKICGKTKLVDIIINEIKNSLKRGEGVELRGLLGTFRTNIQKESIRRNPKTGTKINVPSKRVIKWKMSKDLFKKLNNEKE